jgi:hypothetical protein
MNAQGVTEGWWFFQPRVIFSATNNRTIYTTYIIAWTYLLILFT